MASHHAPKADLGPLASPGARRGIYPYAGAAALTLAAMALDRGSHGSGMGVAALLAVASVAAAFLVPWARLPRSSQAWVPVVYLVSTVVTIHSDGGLGSPYVPALVVPLMWLAVHESHRAFWAAHLSAVTYLAVEAATSHTVDVALHGLVAAGVGATLLPAVRKLVASERMLVCALDALATTDPLTGLLNRRGLDRDATAAAPGAGLGVVYVDVDHFKRVNDELGHDAGDQLLVEVARRITGVARSGDVVARLGGDEFVVVAQGDAQAAAALARRIDDALNGEPYPLADSLHALTATVGTSHARDGRDPWSLIDSADRTMYTLRRVARTSARQP